MPAVLVSEYRHFARILHIELFDGTSAAATDAASAILEQPRRRQMRGREGRDHARKHDARARGDHIKRV
jgi:hypothetical protein